MDLAAGVLGVGRQARRLKVLGREVVEGARQLVHTGRRAVAVGHQDECVLTREGNERLDEGGPDPGLLADLSDRAKAALGAILPQRSASAEMSAELDA